MKNLFWIIAFLIASVNCEHAGNIVQQQFTGPRQQLFYYQNLPQQYNGLSQLQYQQQLQFSGRLLPQQQLQQNGGIQLQQFYQQVNQQVPLQNFPLPNPAQQLPIQQLQAQHFPVQQLPLQQFLPQQFPVQFVNQLDPNIGQFQGPIRGSIRGAFPGQQRTALVQLPYTRAIASRPQGLNNNVHLNGGQFGHGFVPSQQDPLGPTAAPLLQLPLPSFLQPQNLIAPTSNEYFSPAPSGSKNIVPAPPLPPLPERPQQKETLFTIFNSIPLAEGHSDGSNIAYTYGKHTGPAFDEISNVYRQGLQQPLFQRALPTFPAPQQPIFTPEGSAFQSQFDQSFGYGGVPNTPIKTVKVVKDPVQYPGNVKLLKIYNENYLTPEELYSRYGTAPVKFVNIIKGGAAQQLVDHNQQLFNYGSPGGYALNNFQNVPLLENVNINPYAYGQTDGAQYSQDFGNLFKNIRRRDLVKTSTTKDSKKA